MDWGLLWDNILFEFWRLLKAPFLVPDLWWIITPIIITTLLMTLYFGTYVHEKLGWNTALSNSVVLLFVGIDLFKKIVNYTSPPSLDELVGHPVMVAVILVLMLEGFLMARAAFKHSIPRKLMFFIASPVPINVQAYVITAVVYTQFRPTWYTLLAAIMLFVLIFVILRGIQEIIHLKRGVHNQSSKPKRGSKKKQ